MTSVIGVIVIGVAATAAAQPAPPQPPVRATGGPPAPQSALPALSEEAAFILEQWKVTQAAMIDQLRLLQQTYRDTGRAEDAAAIAAHVRRLQQRVPPVTGAATAELVNEGLHTRDEPVRLVMFRQQVGQTLSFAIRGRSDQLVYGTTTYSEDSALETAAVHAGLLREGQRGIVKVRILPGQELYEGSAQHGVKSERYGRHSASFRFMGVAVSVPNRTSAMSSYRDLVGHSITIPVVGAATGSVWGSDIYTDDSSVAAAAVHSGALRVGELGWVKVTLMPGEPRYQGSQRNGVTSQAYEAFEGSFRVEPAAPPSVIELPAGEDASSVVSMPVLRGRTDFYFVVQVVGSTRGTVWGSGVYTDDSSIATAAVHAGLLKPDELGFIRVSIAEGLESYPASERNGIKSLPYGAWQGSFRLERVR
jgi:hypothetical protein